MGRALYSGVPRSSKVETPAKQVAGFIAKFDPAIAKLTRGARAKMRKRLPTAVELVYDNYNALAIGFGPTERTTDAILSVAAYATGVTLYFTYGKSLPDPDKRLEGAGNQDASCGSRAWACSTSRSSPHWYRRRWLVRARRFRRSGATRS